MQLQKYLTSTCNKQVEELGKLTVSLLVEFIIRTQLNHKIKNCSGALIIIFKNNTEKPTVVSLIIQRYNICVSTIHYGKCLFTHAYSEETVN